jgi:hypothetical protein
MFVAGASPVIARNALSERRDYVLVIAFCDALGAGVAAALILFFGVTRPGGMVDQFHRHPALAWAFVGILGPFVSSGISALLAPPGAATRPAGEEAGRLAVGRHLAEARIAAAARVLDEAQARVVSADRTERNHLLTRSRRLIERGRLTFNVLDECISEDIGMRRIAMPHQIAKLLDEGRSPDVGGVTQLDLEVLVETALQLRLKAAIRRACETAEQRDGSQPG